MEKIYILEGLDCPNCALKIEKALIKNKYIIYASVNAATLLCNIEYSEFNEQIEKEVIQLIEELEDIKVKKKEHHHKHKHEDCGCGHHHEHKHEDCECGCHHEHYHEHRNEPNNKGLRKIKWIIEGLDCAHCALKVEDAVNKVDGVNYASINFTTKTLLFYLEDKVNEDKVKNNVKQAILDKENVQIIEENEANVVKKDNKKYLIILGILLLPVGLYLNNNILFIISYLLVGYKVIIKALKNIKRGEIFDENFLMLIATIGAVFVGEYLEAVAVMLFYQVGEYFQDKAVDKSRRSISELMNIKSDIAHIEVNGEFKDVHPDEVRVGDVILVQPGERVPLDGIVVKGNTSVDTSALTGESMPKDLEVNDEILGGYINLNSLIEIKVTHETGESTVSRILDMVENASSKKAKTELKMTRFARIYTPIVVISALILAILPNLFNTGISWQEWLIRACTFLVISCPCALVLSIPLGYFAGIGRASIEGILVKGGNYLELLSEVDTVVFDKTGTLTTGKFEVTKVDSDNPDECLRLACLAESYSLHPIAISIQNEYGREINKDEIDSIEEIAGCGIKAIISGNEVLVGNTKLMNQFHINFKETQSIGTIVYVAYNSNYMGTIEISDTVKENTKEYLVELKNKGVKKLVMLTGDRNVTAISVANQVGIDKVYSELLPNDKIDKLEEIMKETNGKVAYVGDGINDAPVLARSDVGIAMGGLGSEAAVEASDIVLMKDDISSLSKGIDIARFTQKIMNQNIVFILGVKAIVLIMSLFGYANMWLGVFADVGVSLIAVINSMRILSK